MTATPRIFYAFRDSPQRRAALAAPAGEAERYLLFGKDELQARGYHVRHGLERSRPPVWARISGASSKRILEGAGGYGGDFATAFGSLGAANASDVVLSTVDTVGIPLVLTKRAGLLRPPLVYVAVGLPERLAKLRSRRMRRLYASAFARCAAVLAYSVREADDVRAWLAAHGRDVDVSFVPFGVDVAAFQPVSAAPDIDVVSVGADPHRDFALLLDVARAHPGVRFVIVATRDAARELRPAPPNVRVERELPFEETRRLLERARVVALPVRENTYSGATTVLLQSMSLGKPVVVSSTSAVASGYGLVDGRNCRLVRPGDVGGFSLALGSLLGDPFGADSLGGRARELVERELTWERYVTRIERALVEAAASARAGSPRE